MKKSLLLFLFATISLSTIGQPLISFQQQITGLTQPVDLVEVNDNSNRLFIVERTGKIKIWKDERLLPTPFIDVAGKITSAGSEQGLLSLAFHPDYRNNGYFFIYYTNTAGSITVARYNRANDSIADPSSEAVLLTIPKSFSNHNGGHLLFGADNLLYFATGDGGSAGDPQNNAQNGQSLLGKMIRIDVNNPNPPYYSIPSNNPYVGSTTVKPEIIAMGLRNPWRWTFDRGTGDMWIADVGQNEWEEVNVVTPANIADKDYGWPCFEGTHTYNGCAAKPNNVVPIFEYPHNNATGGFSITGGYVYRGDEFPALKGYYICNDYVSRNGWLIKPNGNGGWTSSMQSSWPSIVSYAETSNGTLYAMSLAGTVYKVNASTPLPIHLVSFKGMTIDKAYQVTWQVVNEVAGSTYIIEKQTGLSNEFIEIYRTKAAQSRSNNEYSVKLSAENQSARYRLKMILPTGETTLSSIINYQFNNSTVFKAVIAGSGLQVTVPADIKYLQVFDTAGRRLINKKINAGEHAIRLSLSSAMRGILSIKAIGASNQRTIQVLY